MIPLLFLTMAAADPPPAAASAAPTAQMEKLLQDCDAHKFETVVIGMVEGKPHQSKVKLCGTRGQTDAAWITTLKDAVAKVKANDKMAPEMREQIASAIDAELQRLGHPDSLALIANSAPSIAKAPPVSPSIAALAPRALPGAAGSTRPLSQDYGGLPPLPKAMLAASSDAVGSFLPTLPAPRMTIQCSTSDDPKDLSSCRRLQVNSLLTIRADETFADTSLRFLRRGDQRAEVQLAQMQAGATRRFALPPRVCQGVANSEVQIEVVRHPKGANDAGQVVDTLGPYDLHC